MRTHLYICLDLLGDPADKVGPVNAGEVPAEFTPDWICALDLVWFLGLDHAYLNQEHDEDKKESKGVSERNRLHGISDFSRI